jgi:DNA uptake protein ComE-like DNA-binding protein
MLSALRVTVVMAVLALAMKVPAALSGVGEPVDINRASVAELLRLPGMTETWARRIVRFRPYRSKLDLLNQGVVSPEIYQRIRDGIVAHRVKDVQ